MGCVKVKKSNFNKKAVFIAENVLFVYLVISMFIFAFFTPVVLGGAHSDYVTVTFTPSGDIDIAVNRTTATFGTVTLGSSNNNPTEVGGTSAYSLTNSGEVKAHVYIKSNHTTDGGEWTLEGAGSPGLDEFSIKLTNSTVGTRWFTNANASWIASLAIDTPVLFGLTLDIGTASVESKLDLQRTRLNFTATLA